MRVNPLTSNRIITYDRPKNHSKEHYKEATGYSDKQHVCINIARKREQNYYQVGKARRYPTSGYYLYARNQNSKTK